MIGVLKGWWASFAERNNIFKSAERVNWHRYGKGVVLEKLGVEYYFGLKAKRLILKFSVCDDEDKFMLAIGIPLLFNFYISVDTPSNRFTRWVGKETMLGGRSTGLSIDKNYINLVFWRADGGWSHDKFCGYQFITDWHTLLFGKSKYELRGASMSFGEAALPPTLNFPEGVDRFLFNIKEEKFIRHYARWYMFWYKPLHRTFTVSGLKDIIVRGKISNQMMYEQTFNVDSKDEAIAHYVAIIRKQMQY